MYHTTKKKPIIISIEGNIGSGKSELIKILRKKYKNKIYFVDEPVKEWCSVTTLDNKNLIEHFYENKQRYSYTFQNYAFITRIKKLKEAIHNTNLDIIVTERSTISDKILFAQMLYENKFLNKMEWEMYCSWFEYFTIHVDKFLYVQTSIDNCMERIQKRNRNGEEQITKLYIEQLHEKHEEWLNNNNKCMILNGNLNIFNEITQQQQLNIIDRFFFSN